MRCHFSSGGAKLWILPSDSVLFVSTRGGKGRETRSGVGGSQRSSLDTLALRGDAASAGAPTAGEPDQPFSSPERGTLLGFKG